MKTHLLDSSEPITEGRSQTAKCGAKVMNAGFVSQGEDIDRMEVSCFRCRKSPALTEKYRYILASGEELKERQRERGAGEITQ